jgi:hypothetical protein
MRSGAVLAVSVIEPQGVAHNMKTNTLILTGLALLVGGRSMGCAPRSVSPDPVPTAARQSISMDPRVIVLNDDGFALADQPSSKIGTLMVFEGDELVFRVAPHDPRIAVLVQDGGTTNQALESNGQAVSEIAQDGRVHRVRLTTAGSPANVGASRQRAYRLQCWNDPRSLEVLVNTITLDGGGKFGPREARVRSGAKLYFAFVGGGPVYTATPAGTLTSSLLSRPDGGAVSEVNASDAET